MDKRYCKKTFIFNKREKNFLFISKEVFYYEKYSFIQNKTLFNFLVAKLIYK